MHSEAKSATGGASGAASVARGAAACGWHLGMVLVAAALGTSWPAFARQDQALPAKAERATEIRISGDVVRLPIVIVQEFPFLESSINGVPGKLMLDTGMEAALTLNDHRFPADGRAAEARFSGSGHAFPAKLIPEVLGIEIGTLRFGRATFVDSLDARALEAITPDFIGWLGYRAFADHALKLDYRRRRATFYSGSAATYLKGERVLAELPFETRKRPNDPIRPGQIGGMTIVTTFDTGQNGALYINERDKARLLGEGHLRPSKSRRGSYDLHGLRLGGRNMPVLRAIDVEPSPSRAAASIGIVEPVQLSIGYSVLHAFKTVWDFRSRKIYLLNQ